MLKWTQGNIKKPQVNMRRVYKFLVMGMMPLLFACVITSSEPTVEAWPKEERVQAHVELGMSYLRRDRLDVARENFNNALAVDSKSSTAYRGLGLVEAKALNLKLAQGYLQRAVSLDPGNIAAVSDYAIMLCQAGSAASGVNVLEKNIKNPELTGLPVKLAFGSCYQADGQTEKAILAYKEVLALDPDLQQALLAMAHLKYSAKNFLSASAFLQRYFYTNTISSDALLLAANVEHTLDNPEERDYYTQQLWSRYPRSKQAIEARELYSK
jgi:type IV pilus assembly protein PilF